MSTVSSFDLYLYAGGYWSEEGLYHGGEAHMVGRLSEETFTLKSVSMYVKELYGYDENMSKVSWFPPETPHKKEVVEDDEILRRKVLNYALGSGATTLYVVREDDPYIGRHSSVRVLRLSDEIPEENGRSDSSSGDSDSDSEADDNITSKMKKSTRVVVIVIWPMLLHK
ncbi:unnamed protein product [Thlaspi arvense]|uniref:Uncharacterized protein n=1 Tax=Thlaspi arvense TaxID=13288 RepID=A0AAU9T9E7_THLAR|nr:unnamed protein product [Thlaspi arvense]